MKYLFLIAAIAVVAVLAQNYPQIGNDFTGDVEMEEEYHQLKMLYKGMLYEDFTNKRQRVDTQHTHETIEDVSFLRFYRNNIEYEVFNTSNFCKNKSMNKTMRGMFSWVVNAQLQNQTCFSKFKHGISGDLWSWSNAFINASLCVNTKQNTKPYWVSYNRVNKGEARLIHFKSFTSGTPDPSYFTIPSICNSDERVHAWKN